MNATPRLSGLQKSRCLPGSGRFSDGQASGRLRFVLLKDKSSMAVALSASLRDQRGLFFGGAGFTQERRSSSFFTVTLSPRRAPASVVRAALVPPSVATAVICVVTIAASCWSYSG
jgi:hypothetical protein